MEHEQVAGKSRCPWFDRLTMRYNALITLDLILSLSKDGGENSGFSAAF
jgi:hypothetical protein